MTSEYTHVPVLLSEIIDLFAPESGHRYVDATLGGAGHAETILEISGPDGMLLGIDADPIALQHAAGRLARFGDRVVLREAYFDDLHATATGSSFCDVAGVLFDLGVSSPQLDTADRGFSFQQEGPLDMRLGPSASTSAEDMVNSLSAGELQRLFQEYGEERFARRIAQRIVEERGRDPIRTTTRLAAIIARAKPYSRTETIHPATRVFQALRIAVNDELGRLRRALPQALDLLEVGGRLAVISFHSLEDRIVKQFMRTEARSCICPPEVPVCLCGHRPALHILTPKPVIASEDEVTANPRSRSAKLRVAVKLATN